MEKLPNKELILKIRENSYAVKFPNNRDFLRIESEKNRLAEGDYTALSYRQDNAGFLAKLIIDTISTFSILVPNLLKDLNVLNYLELDLIQQNELTLAYLNQFYPWYNSWLKIISNPDQVKEDEKQDNKVE